MKNTGMGDELLLAGWTLIRPLPTPRDLGWSLPAHLTTISQCIQDDLPRPEWADWAVDRSLLEKARIDAAPDATLMAVAMSVDESLALIDRLGGADDASFGLLRQQRPAGSEPLGWEVVGAEPELTFHSWHCHGYADQVLADLGIAVTDRGLLGSAADAEKVRDWMLQLPNDQAPREVAWTFIALIST